MFPPALIDGIDNPAGSLELIFSLHEVLNQLDSVVEWIARVLQPRYHLIACLIGSLPFNAISYSPPCPVNRFVFISGAIQRIWTNRILPQGAQGSNSSADAVVAKD